MEKPPPVETAVTVRLNGPNDVPNGIIEKSSAAVPEVSVVVPENVVAVSRLPPPMSETEISTKGICPLISLACNIAVQAVITAKKNK